MKNKPAKTKRGDDDKTKSKKVKIKEGKKEEGKKEKSRKSGKSRSKKVSKKVSSGDADLAPDLGAETPVATVADALADWVRTRKDLENARRQASRVVDAATARFDLAAMRLAQAHDEHSGENVANTEADAARNDEASSFEASSFKASSKPVKRKRQPGHVQRPGETKEAYETRMEQRERKLKRGQAYREQRRKEAEKAKKEADAAKTGAASGEDKDEEEDKDGEKKADEKATDEEEDEEDDDDKCDKAKEEKVGDLVDFVSGSGGSGLPDISVTDDI